MTVKTYEIHTCDRCGNTQEVEAGKSPPEWGNIRVGTKDNVFANDGGELCPSCFAAYRGWWAVAGPEPDAPAPGAVGIHHPYSVITADKLAVNTITGGGSVDASEVTRKTRADRDHQELDKLSQNTIAELTAHIAELRRRHAEFDVCGIIHTVCGEWAVEAPIGFATALQHRLQKYLKGDDA